MTTDHYTNKLVVCDNDTFMVANIKKFYLPSFDFPIIALFFTSLPLINVFYYHIDLKNVFI